MCRRFTARATSRGVRPAAAPGAGARTLHYLVQFLLRTQKDRVSVFRGRTGRCTVSPSIARAPRHTPLEGADAGEGASRRRRGARRARGLLLSRLLFQLRRLSREPSSEGGVPSGGSPPARDSAVLPPAAPPFLRPAGSPEHPYEGRRASCPAPRPIARAVCPLPLQHTHSRRPSPDLRLSPARIAAPHPPARAAICARAALEHIPPACYNPSSGRALRSPPPVIHRNRYCGMCTGKAWRKHARKS